MRFPAIQPPQPLRRAPAAEPPPTPAAEAPVAERTPAPRAEELPLALDERLRLIGEW